MSTRGLRRRLDRLDGRRAYARVHLGPSTDVIAVPDHGKIAAAEVMERWPGRYACIRFGFKSGDRGNTSRIKC